MRGTYKSEVNIIISISGFWNDINQLRKLIDNSTKCKYWLVENYLLHREEKEKFVFHFENYKPTLTRYHTRTGLNPLKKHEENKNNQHHSTLYLMSKGGSIENAKKIMLAANCILNVGGYEIGIVTAGIIHSKETWKKFIENDRLMDCIFAFVVSIQHDKEDFYFTCGMHNLGYPDVVVPGYLDYDQANYLAKAFAYYLVEYNPVLFSGGKFRIDRNSPNTYRLTYEKCHIYDNCDKSVYWLFHNPYGLWRLTESNL
ncbi:MAG: hypothetical protein WBH31_05165 [Promethearchaeia archaeon]